MGWLLPLSLITALLADQSLKAWVLAGLRGNRTIALGSAVRIRPVVRGTTIAGRLGVRPILLWCAWLGCLLGVLLVAPRTGQFAGPVAQVALGTALGGAAGNLFDVLARNGVVDYLELGRWPAFNLADVAIVSGVIVALLAR